MVVAFGSPVTLRAQRARARSRAVSPASPPRRTPAAVAGSDRSATLHPQASEQYASPSVDAVAVTRTPRSRLGSGPAARARTMTSNSASYVAGWYAHRREAFITN